MKADVEWSKLSQVPGLVDGWTDVKDKVGIATEEFKAGDHPSPYSTTHTFAFTCMLFVVLCYCVCPSHVVVTVQPVWPGVSVTRMNERCTTLHINIQDVQICKWAL